ncbi:MAG TPA: iron ABC transporter permease, partial [Planctomycetota bacterium]|nr:iron ABC transporter permease [Planctomycetota bacterium]
MKGRLAPRAFLLTLFVALAIAALLHLCCTREGPGVSAVFASLRQLLGLGGVVDPFDLDHFVVTQVRLPRLVVAIFGGASLGLAGAVMQAAFRNPLASPDIVGTAAGAAFGGALAIVTGVAAEAILAVPLASLLGALLVTWLVFTFAGTGARFSTTGLLLAGVALNTLVGALTTFVVTARFGNYSISSDVLFWLMGGLDARTWDHAAITAGGFVLFAAPVALRTRELDLLTLRDDSAHSLGIDAPQVRRWV